MDYIHYFDTETNHNSVYHGSAYTEPWVAYIEENKKCIYNKIKQYLIGTAKSTFTPSSGAFSGYTFTTPTFKVIYTGGTLTDLSNAFNNNYYLSSITKSTLDTSNVTNMFDMFFSCANLTDISGLSNWDTNKVTNMDWMFGGCKSLTTLDLSNWKTSKVTEMYGMFYECESLTTLDLSNFNTSNVTNMYKMFSGCKSLTTLDLSNWKTSNVVRMESMFYGCSSLIKVKVTNCSSDTQQNILSQLISDTSDKSWTLNNGIITRS